MLNPRDLERTREHLETFLARVRPSPSQRTSTDISYQLSEAAFVLRTHVRAAESMLLTPHACFKAVHSEEPAGWQLYVPDEQGHWVVCPELSFAEDLEDALEVAALMLPRLGPETALSAAI